VPEPIINNTLIQYFRAAKQIFDSAIMVVKADGSKWACSSCLKGHRVSGCNHTDRELTLVPKKGRPVTQCHHCRLERKKRSAHVKCDCGEENKVHHPKEKCIHLREAEERAKAGLQDDASHDKDSEHLMTVAEEQGCCCHHGGKCTCSLLKKDPADMLLDSMPHGPAVQKPRLESTKSDGSITVFANGHHKPVHRKNNAAHESGMPYKRPLPRSSTDHILPASARRSVDSLTLNTNLTASQAPFSLLTNLEASMFSSEQHSPITQDAGRSGSLGANFSNIDLSTLGLVPTNQSVDSVESSQFPIFDPMSGVDNSYDPWSTFPSSDSLVFPNNNPFGAWATTFDASALAQPALTAGSSCTQSDIDEIPPTDEIYQCAMPSIAEDDLNDASAEGNNGNRRSLPPNFFGNTDFTAAFPNNWQPLENGSEQNLDANKVKSPMQTFNSISNESWSTPTMNNAVHRGMVPTGRPQSHSIGPGSAPNDDIIKQLFPDIDVATTFGSVPSPGDMAFMAMKRFGGFPSDDRMPSSAEYIMDESAAFTTQPWTDGTMPITNDVFTHAYNLDQDFSTPDFSSSWQRNQ